MKIDVVERPILVPGFRFGGVACGIKKSGAPDCAVLIADRPAAAGAVFTRNRFCAAPVLVGRERVRRGKLQALVVNSGNANACTGKQGLADAERACAAVAEALSISPTLVAPASTGIIGVPLPMDRLEDGIARAVAEASSDGLWRFARAIMTTDAFPKVASESVTIGRRRVTVAGIGKGAGMIAPDMATLLVFIVTDAAVDAATARWLAREVGARPFNELTVDGDTSTNDTLYLLASGAAGNPVVTGDGAVRRALARAVDAVAGEIARLVACDGEGTTKVVTIHVQGARSEADAVRVARTVGRSQLVKTAFFGADPNWGRIACAIGYSGVAVDPQKVSIRIGGVEVFRRGGGIASAAEAARAVMQRPEFDVTIRLGQGRAQARLRTSDLSHDYVELNSAYST
ncbi:MAG TPA: bifunctional glutamate N-acetyltransferase/amino-acid acetyltransferase ArgJ [Candidatus Binatia bacterium]